MPKLTIIRDDNLVGVDGVFRTVNVSDLPATVHAVQWDGTKGFVEVKGTKAVTPLSSIGDYLGIIDRWNLAAQPSTAEPTDLERAEAEVARLRFEALQEIENARIEAALEAEGGKIGGSAKAKAYIKAKGELAALNAKRA